MFVSFFLLIGGIWLILIQLGLGGLGPSMTNSIWILGRGWQLVFSLTLSSTRLVSSIRIPLPQLLSFFLVAVANIAIDSKHSWKGFSLPF